MADWLTATVVEIKQWTDHLYSLRFEAPLTAFKAGQFVRVALDIDGERVGRPYSLVNAPGETPYEIYFNIVPEGPLSSRLAELKPGDTLYVYGSPNGFLTLEEIPESRYLWLFATGTAIGPYLSILKSAEAWPRFERIILAHSVRRAEELTYQDVISELLETHPEQMDYLPLVTQEKIAGALNMRIPAAIAAGELESRVNLTLSPETGHVMLCGNAEMIQDTHDILDQRGLKRHRRREPGHISTEKYH